MTLHTNTVKFFYTEFPVKHDHARNTCFTSVQSLSCVRLLATHGQQHDRLPCPSPTPRAYSSSCPSSWWCHPTISSCDVPFSSHLQSIPASGSFQMNQFFASGGQCIRASASVLPMNTQDWFPLGLTGSILQSKELQGDWIAQLVKNMCLHCSY